MLGNVAPLWECMLAAMKLGAVVVPATTLLTAADLAERVARGAGAVSSSPRRRTPQDRRSGRRRRAHRRRRGAPGCSTTKTLLRRRPSFAPDGETAADDPLLLYFTSGTTAKPKLVLHSHALSGRPSLDHVLARPAAGRRASEISSPGWAKHAWSSFFAPWNAGATVFIANQPRFNARGLLDTIARLRRDHAVRAADGLADAGPGGPGRLEDRAARSCRRRRTAQSGSDRPGAAPPGA